MSCKMEEEASVASNVILQIEMFSLSRKIGNSGSENPYFYFHTIFLFHIPYFYFHIFIFIV